MILCDMCGKQINTLKDHHHSIPFPGREENETFMTILCHECYQKFTDDLKRMEELE